MTALAPLAADDRSARMLLSILAAPCDDTTGKLLEAVSSVKLVALADGDGPIPGMDPVEAAVWRDRLQAAAARENTAGRMIDAAEHCLIIPSDSYWPTALNNLGYRAPWALWARGNTELLTQPLSQRVTVTGARACTGYGAHVTDELTGDLARDGRTIVAGAAYGVEGAAHRAALAQGAGTIAVLASGIARPYPAAHRELLESIASEGLVLSEAPPSMAPTLQRFIDRSRILAAISGATIITEAGSRSGALRTAAEASQLGRAVYAVPGPVTSAASAGSNLLIQNGTARLA